LHLAAVKLRRATEVRRRKEKKKNKKRETK
jgi:hypothetical protein